MDDDRRRQKVEAAKQTLAKYRKKKTRQTKISHTNDGMSEVIVNETFTTIDDDDDDKTKSQDEEKDSAAMLLQRRPSQDDVRHASNIIQLEEMLTDRPSIVGNLVEENERLRAQISQMELSGRDIVDDLPVPEKEALDSLEGYSKKLREFEDALARRDEVIGMLSSNLRTMTENRDTLQVEYTSQANQLMQQVLILQQQLKQAGNWLHIQDHSLSAQALLEAKNELLALHENCRQKENQLVILQNLIHERDTTLQQLIVRFNDSTRDFAQIHEENRMLKQRLEATEAEIIHLQKERNALKAEKEEYNKMLHELHADSGSVEKESIRLLTHLQQENEMLRRKEQQNAEVVRQLMTDVETRHRETSVSHSKAQDSDQAYFTREELDLEIDTQLTRLRAELDEIYGTEIARMKEHLQDKHLSELDRMNGELSRTMEERNRFSAQVNLWQQQYVLLSQQNVSSTDLVEQLNASISENIHQRQLNDELQTRLKILENEQKQRAATSGVTKTEQVDLKGKHIHNQSILEDLRVLQADLHALQKSHGEDLVKISRLESDLSLSRIECAQTKEKYSTERDKFHKETADDRERLTLQLSESQNQLKLLESQLYNSQSANAELTCLKEQIYHMQHDHAEQVDALKIEYDKFVAELKLYHDKEMETLMQQHTSKVNEFQSVIKKQQQDHLDLKKQKEELETAYCMQLENLKRKMVENEEALQNEVKQMGNQMEEMKVNLTLEHSKEMEDRVEETEKKYNQIISMLRQEHEMTVAQLNDRLNVTLSENEILAHSSQVPERPNVIGDLQLRINELSSKLAKVTKERDSAMQSLQTVYSDRIEMKQTLDQMNSEKEHLLAMMGRVTEEKQLAESNLSAVCLERDDLRRFLDGQGSRQDLLSHVRVHDSASAMSESTAVIEELEAIVQEKQSLKSLMKSGDKAGSHVPLSAGELPDSSQRSLVDQLRYQFEDLKVRYSHEIKESKEYQVLLLERLEILMQENELLRAKTDTVGSNQPSAALLSQRLESLSAELEERNKLIAELKLAQDTSAKDQKIAMESQLLEKEVMRNEITWYKKQLEQLKSSEASVEWNSSEGMRELVEECEMLPLKLIEKQKRIETLEITLKECDGSSQKSAVKYSRKKSNDFGAIDEGEIDPNEFLTLKQEYALVCAELLRLREMLSGLQNVNREREDVRLEFEKQIALLKEELQKQLNDPSNDDMSSDFEEVLKQKEVEIQDLRNQLSKALEKLNELLIERDSQRSDYENELEQIRSEHTEALQRIDALVQEHNIMFQGFGSNSMEPIGLDLMPQFSDQNIEEEPSPRKIVYEAQGLELTRVRNELLEVLGQVDVLSAENSKLRSSLEAASIEFLKNMDDANAHSKKEKDALEKALAGVRAELMQSNLKVETFTLEHEQLIASHKKELDCMVDEYEAQNRSLVMRSEETRTDYELEVSAIKKRLSELQNEIEDLRSEKVSLEQEFVSEMKNTYKEHDSRVKTVRESYEQEMDSLRTELGKQKEELASRSEELDGFRQQNASLTSQLQQMLQERDWTKGRHLSEMSPEMTQSEKEANLLLHVDRLKDEKAALKSELHILKEELSANCEELEKSRIANEDLRRNLDALTPTGEAWRMNSWSECYVGDNNAECDENERKEPDISGNFDPATKILRKRIRSLHLEKELMAGMVERLNREKDQLVSYLVTRSRFDQAYEIDTSQLEFQSRSETSIDSRDQRLKSLEIEKELLVGMLEKLNQENEKLVTHIGTLKLSEIDYDDVKTSDSSSEITNNLSLFSMTDVSTTDVTESLSRVSDNSTSLIHSEFTFLKYENSRLQEKIKEYEQTVKSLQLALQDKEQLLFEAKIKLAEMSEDKPTEAVSLETDCQGKVNQLHDTTDSSSSKGELLSDMTETRSPTDRANLANIDADTFCTTTMPQSGKSAERCKAESEYFKEIESLKHQHQIEVECLSSQISEIKMQQSAIVAEIRLQVTDLMMSAVLSEDFTLCLEEDEESGLIIRYLQLLKHKHMEASRAQYELKEERMTLEQEVESIRGWLLKIQPLKETGSELTTEQLMDNMNEVIRRMSDLEEMNALIEKEKLESVTTISLLKLELEKVKVLNEEAEQKLSMLQNKPESNILRVAVGVGTSDGENIETNLPEFVDDGSFVSSELLGNQETLHEESIPPNKEMIQEDLRELHVSFLMHEAIKLSNQLSSIVSNNMEREDKSEYNEEHVGVQVSSGTEGVSRENSVESMRGFNIAVELKGVVATLEKLLPMFAEMTSNEMNLKEKLRDADTNSAELNSKFRELNEMMASFKSENHSAVATLESKILELESEKETLLSQMTGQDLAVVTTQNELEQLRLVNEKVRSDFATLEFEVQELAETNQKLKDALDANHEKLEISSEANLNSDGGVRSWENGDIGTVSESNLMEAAVEAKVDLCLTAYSDNNKVDVTKSPPEHQLQNKVNRSFVDSSDASQKYTCLPKDLDSYEGQYEKNVISSLLIPDRVIEQGIQIMTDVANVEVLDDGIQSECNAVSLEYQDQQQILFDKFSLCSDSASNFFNEKEEKFSTRNKAVTDKIGSVYENAIKTVSLEELKMLQELIATLSVRIEVQEISLEELAVWGEQLTKENQENIVATEQLQANYDRVIVELSEAQSMLQDTSAKSSSIEELLLAKTLQLDEVVKENQLTVDELKRQLDDALAQNAEMNQLLQQEEYQKYMCHLKMQSEKLILDEETVDTKDTKADGDQSKLVRHDIVEKKTMGLQYAAVETQTDISHIAREDQTAIVDTMGRESQIFNNESLYYFESLAVEQATVGCQTPIVSQTEAESQTITSEEGWSRKPVCATVESQTNEISVATTESQTTVVFQVVNESQTTESDQSRMSNLVYASVENQTLSINSTATERQIYGVSQNVAESQVPITDDVSRNMKVEQSTKETQTTELVQVTTESQTIASEEICDNKVERATVASQTTGISQAVAECQTTAPVDGENSIAEGSCSSSGSQMNIISQTTTESQTIGVSQASSESQTVVFDDTFDSEVMCVSVGSQTDALDITLESRLMHMSVENGMNNSGEIVTEHSSTVALDETTESVPLHVRLDAVTTDLNVVMDGEIPSSDVDSFRSDATKMNKERLFVGMELPAVETPKKDIDDTFLKSKMNINVDANSDQFVVEGQLKVIDRANDEIQISVSQTSIDCHDVTVDYATTETQLVDDEIVPLLDVRLATAELSTLRSDVAAEWESQNSFSDPVFENKDLLKSAISKHIEHNTESQKIICLLQERLEFEKLKNAQHLQGSLKYVENPSDQFLMQSQETDFINASADKGPVTIEKLTQNMVENQTDESQATIVQVVKNTIEGQTDEDRLIGEKVQITYNAVENQPAVSQVTNEGVDSTVSEIWNADCNRSASKMSVGAELCVASAEQDTAKTQAVVDPVINEPCPDIAECDFTALDRSNVESQTDFVNQATTESQTTLVYLATVESQTALLYPTTTESQTTAVDLAEVESQTAHVDLTTVESQTALVDLAEVESQTTAVGMATSESAVRVANLAVEESSQQATNVKEIIDSRLTEVELKLNEKIRELESLLVDKSEQLKKSEKFVNELRANSMVVAADNENRIKELQESLNAKENELVDQLKEMDFCKMEVQSHKKAFEKLQQDFQVQQGIIENKDRDSGSVVEDIEIKVSESLKDSDNIVAECQIMEESLMNRELFELSERHIATGGQKEDDARLVTELSDAKVDQNLTTHNQAEKLLKCEIEDLVKREECIQEELHSSNDSLTIATDELSAARHSLVEAQEAGKAMRCEFDELQQNENILKQDLLSLTSEFIAIKNELTVAKKTLLEAHDSADLQRFEYERLQKNAEAVKQELLTLTVDFTKAKSELKAAEKLQNEFEESQKKEEIIKQELLSLTCQLNEARNELIMTRKSLHESEDSMKLQKIENEKFQANERTVKQQLHSLTDELSQTKVELATAQKCFADVNEAEKMLKIEFEEVQRKDKTFQQEMELLTAELTKAKEELLAMKTILDEAHESESAHKCKFESLSKSNEVTRQELEHLTEELNMARDALVAAQKNLVDNQEAAIAQKLEFEELQTNHETRELEVQSLTNELRKVKGKLITAQKRFAEVQEAEKLQKTELEELSKQEESLRQELLTLTGEFTSTRNELTVVTQGLEEANERVKVREVEFEELQKNCETIEQDLGFAKDELCATRKILTETQHAEKLWKFEFEELQKKEDAMKQELLSLTDNLSTTRDELHAKQNSLDKVHEELTSKTNEVYYLECQFTERIKILKHEKESLDAVIHNLEKLVTEKDDRVLHLENTLENLEQKLFLSEQDSESLLNSLNEYQKKQRSSVEEHQKTLVDLNSKVAVAECERDRAVRQCSEIEVEMQERVRDLERFEQLRVTQLAAIQEQHKLTVSELKRRLAKLEKDESISDDSVDCLSSAGVVLKDEAKEVKIHDNPKTKEEENRMESSRVKETDFISTDRQSFLVESTSEMSRKGSELETVLSSPKSDQAISDGISADARKYIEKLESEKQEIERLNNKLKESHDVLLSKAELLSNENRLLQKKLSEFFPEHISHSETTVESSPSSVKDPVKCGSADESDTNDAAFASDSNMSDCKVLANRIERLQQRVDELSQANEVLATQNEFMTESVDRVEGSLKSAGYDLEKREFECQRKISELEGRLLIASEETQKMQMVYEDQIAKLKEALCSQASSPVVSNPLVEFPCNPDLEFELARLKEENTILKENLRLSRRAIEDLESKLSSHARANENQDVLMDWEEKFKNLEKQHETELEILKLQLTETRDIQDSNVHSELIAQMEETFNKKEKQMCSEYEQSLVVFKIQYQQRCIEEFNRVKCKWKESHSMLSDSCRLSKLDEQPLLLQENDPFVETMLKEVEDLMDSHHRLLKELDACRCRYESVQEENSHLCTQIEELNSALKRLSPTSSQDFHKSPKFVAEQDAEEWREKLQQLLREPGCIEESSLFASGLLSPSSCSGSESVLLSDDGHQSPDIEELSPKVRSLLGSKILKTPQMNENYWESEGSVTHRLITESRDSTSSCGPSSLQSPKSDLHLPASIEATESVQQKAFKAHHDPMLPINILKAGDSFAFNPPMERPVESAFIQEPSHGTDAFEQSQDNFPEEFPKRSELVDESNLYKQMARDISILKHENEKLKSKAQRDHSKLKNRLIVTLKELGFYKSRNSSLEALEGENSSLLAHVNDLEICIQELEASQKMEQRQEKEQAREVSSIAAKVVEFSRFDKGIYQESAMIGDKATVGEDRLREKMAAMELELEVLRSQCCMLAQKNISLEQLVIRFRSAARQSSSLVQNEFTQLAIASAPATNQSVLRSSTLVENDPNGGVSVKASDLSRVTEPAAEGDDSERDLQSENRQLISRLQEQKSFYESNIQCLERKCSHLEKTVTCYWKTSTGGEACGRCSFLESEYEGLKLQSELELSMAKKKLEELLGKYLQMQAEFNLERQKSTDDMMTKDDAALSCPVDSLTLSDTSELHIAGKCNDINSKAGAVEKLYKLSDVTFTINAEDDVKSQKTYDVQNELTDFNCTLLPCESETSVYFESESGGICTAVYDQGQFIDVIGIEPETATSPLAGSLLSPDNKLQTSGFEEPATLDIDLEASYQLSLAVEQDIPSETVVIDKDYISGVMDIKTEKKKQSEKDDDNLPLAKNNLRAANRNLRKTGKGSSVQDISDSKQSSRLKNKDRSLFLANVSGASSSSGKLLKPVERDYVQKCTVGDNGYIIVSHPKEKKLPLGSQSRKSSKLLSKQCKTEQSKPLSSLAVDDQTVCLQTVSVVDGSAKMSELVRQSEKLLHPGEACTKKLKQDHGEQKKKKQQNSKAKEKEEPRERLTATALDVPCWKRNLVKENQDERRWLEEKSRYEKELRLLKHQSETSCKENIHLLQLIRESGKAGDASELVLMRVQYEILLEDKKELCRNFELEKAALLEELNDLKEAKEACLNMNHEKSNTVTSAGDVNEALNKDIELSNMACKLQELSRQLSDVSAKLCKTQDDNVDLQSQLQQLRAAERRDAALKEEHHKLRPDVVEMAVNTVDPCSAIDFMLELDREQVNKIEPSLERLGQGMHLQNQKQEVILEHKSLTSAVIVEIPSKESEIKDTEFIVKSHEAIEALDLQKNEIGYIAEGNSYKSDTSPFKEMHEDRVVEMCNFEVLEKFCWKNATGVSGLYANFETQCLSHASSLDAASGLLFASNQGDLSYHDLLIQCELLVEEKRQLCQKLELEENQSQKLNLELSGVRQQAEVLRNECQSLRDNLNCMNIQLSIVSAEKNELSLMNTEPQQCNNCQS